jgi:hypothetical protein
VLVAVAGVVVSSVVEKTGVVVDAVDVAVVSNPNVSNAVEEADSLVVASLVVFVLDATV